MSEDESHAVGNAAAIGISAGGISAAQLNALKSRLEATKAKLQAGDLNGLTGEQISGDLLSATLWSWFAAAESHGRLSQRQAGMVENPGLSYGLFHAVADPVYSWGLIRKVNFPGVNMDVGHVRPLVVSMTGDSAEWVNYNRLRGQYMSALEHAVPERFFSDTSQCNLVGDPAPQPGLPNCPQGISAVKALGLAAAQGQRIYTITPEVYQNKPGIVSTGLSAHSLDTRQRVQQALDAGFEVAIHQSPVAQDGWTGAGFTVIDPATGAGGYLIEGGGKGGQFAVGLGLGSLLIASGLIAGEAYAALATSVFLLGPLVLFVLAAILFSLILTTVALYYAETGSPCLASGIGFSASVPLIKLPGLFAWAFAALGWTLPSDPAWSCIGGN